MIVNWVLSALAVWFLPSIVSGVHVRTFTTALVAALVIGFVNAGRHVKDSAELRDVLNLWLDAGAELERKVPGGRNR